MRAPLIRTLWLRSRRLSAGTRYLGAVVLALLVCAVRYELNVLWGATYPYVFAFAATLFTALFAGTRPALVGMAVIALLTTGLVLVPNGLFAVNAGSATAGLLAFLLVDSAIAWLGGQHRYLLCEAESQREALVCQTTARTRAEEHLRRALDAAGMVAWDWEIETGVVERSQNAARVLGVAGTQADQLLAVVHPEDRARLDEKVAAVLAGAGSYDLEYRIVRPDGAVRWLADQATLSTSATTGHRHLSGVCVDVTVRREAQDRLREAHALLDTLRNQAPIGFAYLDRDLRYVSVNRWLADINGLTEAEHIGRTVREVLPSLAEQVETVTAQVLATGRTVHDYQVIGGPPNDSGAQRWWNESWYPVRDASGEITGFGVVVEEITARKLAERSLQQSEERFRWLAESMPQFVWQSGPDGQLEYVNERWTRYSGLDLAESRNGEALKNLFHPDERERLAAAWAQARTTRRALQEEARLRSRSGEWRWFIMRAEPVLQEGQLRGWLGTSTDITERKQGEDALRRSEERFRQLANATPQLVWVADGSGAVTYYNSRAQHYAGLSQREDGRWEWQPLVHPDDRSRTVKAWQSAVETRAAYEIEHRVRVVDGSYRWHLSRAFPLDHGDGVQWFGTATDVHDIKEAQEALRVARDEAQAANRAKDDFLAALSHELRTPLTPVLLCSTILAEEPSLTAEIREDLAMIRRNVALEARLIDDLLDVTRIARGKLELQREKADTHLLLRQASEMVAGDAVQKGVSLRWELGAGDVLVHADPARMQQVFWNLLHNAVKFTDAGGTVTVRTFNPEPGQLRIEFADTGRGIAPEALTRIFHPFDQGELEGARHRFGGLGLGLAICKAIVEMHRGWLRVESEGLGRGATFSLEVPTTNEPGARIAAPGGNGGEQAAPPGLRLLLVEDHLPTLETLTRLLRRDGHAVQAAKTKAEALALAGAHEFDLVLSDLGLPDGSGLELMRSIREQHGWPGVALTGFGAPEDVAAAAESGYHVHLTKPVDLTRLRSALGEALESRA